MRGGRVWPQIARTRQVSSVDLAGREARVDASGALPVAEVLGGLCARVSSRNQLHKRGRALLSRARTIVAALPLTRGADALPGEPLSCGDSLLCSAARSRCLFEARGRALLRCAHTDDADGEATVFRRDSFPRRDSRRLPCHNVRDHMERKCAHPLSAKGSERRRQLFLTRSRRYARGFPASSAQPPLLRKPSLLSVSGAAPATFAVVFSFWHRRSAISPLSARCA